MLDIKRFGDNHAIGDRCYGATKEDVVKYGIPVMKELQKEGIISVIKHFPGHGATKKDSHYFLPIIKKDINKIEQEDLYPFIEAIKNNADAVLVGHLLIKNLTGIYPASLSRKFIVEYIRKKYRYNGLIITDDLKMKAIKFVYGAELATKKAFEAGNDIIVFRFNKREEKKIIEKIVSLAKGGKLKQSRINNSVKRIINIKQKYEVSDEAEIPGINIEEINEEINEIRKICGM